MRFSPLTWMLFIISFIISVPVALAAHAPKKTSRKKTSSSRVIIESYPAMEDEEIILPEPPKPEAVSEIQPIQNTPVASAPQSVDSKYEVVPEEKRAQVLKRLELCQALFKKSGRAYDYRVLTTAELEKEMIRLNREKQTVTLRQDSDGLFRPVQNDSQ